MRAEILCVGTELLLGDIVNTNAAYIAKELAAIGVNVYHQAVVGDKGLESSWSGPSPSAIWWCSPEGWALPTTI